MLQVLRGRRALGLTRREAAAYFDELDKDGNGTLDRAEFEAASAALKAARVVSDAVSAASEYYSTEAANTMRRLSFQFNTI